MPQPSRLPKGPAGSPAGDPVGEESKVASPSRVEQLRLQRSEGARDLIPIPALIAVFAVVWVLVLYLLLPDFPVQFNTYLARATQMRGNYQAAIPPLTRLVERFPTSETFLSELALAYYRTEKYDKALEYFLKAQKVAEEGGSSRTTEDGPVARADFSTSIGMTYFQLKDYENAEKYLQAALKRDRLDKFANLTMGELEVARKNYPRAMGYFKVIASDPQFRAGVQKYYERIENELFAGVS